MLTFLCRSYCYCFRRHWFSRTIYRQQTGYGHTTIQSFLDLSDVELAKQGCTVIIPYREEMAKRHLKVSGDLGRVVFMVPL